ncbi:hypothetical protein HKCCE3408_02425 [Rhodobacterales bacterium HKCCE3408]|nr:hypothetical protein [Rhodobacterales bacterium HKCCE3408]
MPRSNGNGGGGTTAASPPPGAITGTAAGDILLGTVGDDVIWSLEGDDEIRDDAGNDTIEAGDGNDTVYNGDGDDLINLGAGGDLVFDGAGSDTVNGGDGTDAVFYLLPQSEYTVVQITEMQGKGKFKTEVIVGYEVTHIATGETDYLNDVEVVTFLEVPGPDTILTERDFAQTSADGTASLNVLANDQIGDTGTPGDGLAVTAILDVQIDLNGDGDNDVDLIPDGVDLSYFEFGGLLTDGSILTVSADGSVTWDPNGQYDIPPAAGEIAGISFWYEVSDGTTSTYEEVAIQVTYPVPDGDISFETMTNYYGEFTSQLLGIWIYEDGPNSSFFVSQLASATQYWEQRYEDPTLGYDFDGDGDDEMRVWTEADGSTHEINVTHRDSLTFDLQGFRLTGFDADDVAEIVFSDGNGNPVGSATITAADLDATGYVEFTNATDVFQFNVIAAAGDEFYLDDVNIL